MRKMIFAGVGAIAMTASAPVLAQETGSRETRNYVEAAGQSDAFEKLEADTALAQSSDPRVRAFAKQMLQDHQRLSDALRQATTQAGVKPPPMGVGADQAPLLGALQSLRGPEFDRLYWRQQALAHHSALTTTRIYASNGDDPVIRNAAAEALPIISAHLAMAEQMSAGFAN